VTVAEPSTLVSDVALSVVSLGFGLAAGRTFRAGRQWSVGLWAAAFLANSLTALIGGLYHGFGPSLEIGQRVALWKATLLLAGATSFMMLSASAIATLSGAWRRALLALAALKLAAFSAFILEHDLFRYVIVDYLASMTVILILHVRIALGERVRHAGPADRAGFWIVAGILVSLLGAILQQSGFDLHDSFNHNDLFHLVQIGANSLFFLGARSLVDRSSEPAAASGAGRDGGRGGSRGRRCSRERP
jgi:hypothetical protein